MKYKVFKEVITKFQEVQEKCQKLYDLGIDLSNSIENDYSEIITLILKSHYGLEGEDMISWWLYEDVEKVLYSSNTNKIIRKLKTIEQLWKYCEELRNSKEFKEYELPKKLSDKERMDILKGIFNTKPTLPPSRIIKEGQNPNKN